MVIGYSVYFRNKELPSIEQIAKNLELVTGLLIEYNSKIESCSAPEINQTVDFYFDKEEVAIIAGSLKLTYLLCSMIYSLKQLGGNYNGLLPEWVGLKWEEVKYKIEDLPNFIPPYKHLN